MYKYFIRPILFLFSPETSHSIAFILIKFLFRLPLVKFILSKIYCIQSIQLQRNVFGLTFQNPIGLAAGFDKNARLINEMPYFGFGFIEIGTITLKPQKGNLKPRIFRLLKSEAIINKLGFNNDGVEKIVSRLKNRKKIIPLGANIGLNKDTPLDNADSDYIQCMEKLYDYVDYFTINISSPNTPGLRELQKEKYLKSLLSTILSWRNTKKIKKPVLLKIAPDLDDYMLKKLLDVSVNSGIDGLIATNTTNNFKNLIKEDESHISLIAESGGLSGKPLFEMSNQIITKIRNVNISLPVIGAGGIFSDDDVNDKLKLGANLVQIYTGFIYEGPFIVKRILKKLICGSY